MVQLSHPYMTTGKTIALTTQTFVSKMMPLLFNTLSRFNIAFLPRSKHLLISWLQSPPAVILEPKKRKSITVSIVSPSICHEVMGLDAMIVAFWVLHFKPAFPLSSPTFIHNQSHKNHSCVLTRWLSVRLQEDRSGRSVQERLERGKGRKLEHSGNVHTIMWNNNPIAPLPRPRPYHAWANACLRTPRSSSCRRGVEGPNEWANFSWVTQPTRREARFVPWLSASKICFNIFRPHHCHWANVGRGSSWRMRTQRIEGRIAI